MLLFPVGTPRLKCLHNYADDNTGIFIDDYSMSHFFNVVEQYQKVSGSKVNYKKSNGLYLGKWNIRSDQPFGISWVRSCKMLGYYFGYDISYVDIWSKRFNKFQVINLSRTKMLSF